MTARVVRLPLKSCMILHGFRIHDDSPSQPPPPLFEDFVGEEMLSFRSAQLPRPCRQHHRPAASRPRRGRAGEGETLALPRPGEMRPQFRNQKRGGARDPEDRTSGDKDEIVLPTQPAARARGQACPRNDCTPESHPSRERNILTNRNNPGIKKTGASVCDWQPVIMNPSDCVI